MKNRKPRFAAPASLSASRHSLIAPASFSRNSTTSERVLLEETSTSTAEADTPAVTAAAFAPTSASRPSIPLTASSVFSSLD